MRRSELAAIKRCPKRLRDVSFKRLRKRDLPKPLDKIGGPRLSHSGLIDVDDSSCVAFIARDGDAPERRLFLGHFFGGPRKVYSHLPSCIIILATRGSMFCSTARPPWTTQNASSLEPQN